MREIKCRNCGVALEIGEDGTSARCTSCGKKYRLETKNRPAAPGGAEPKAPAQRTPAPRPEPAPPPDPEPEPEPAPEPEPSSRLTVKPAGPKKQKTFRVKKTPTRSDAISAVREVETASRARLEDTSVRSRPRSDDKRVYIAKLRAGSCYSHLRAVAWVVFVVALLVTAGVCILEAGTAFKAQSPMRGVAVIGLGLLGVCVAYAACQAVQVCADIGDVAVDVGNRSAQKES
ncbi:MAG: hypothetical protein JXR37_10530 [Kiritimatiellae bacterium]|nr:hypothetical protein [Kiritimatiellia bacterium]